VGSVGGGVGADETEDAGFGGGVGAVCRGGEEAEDGGDVCYGAALRWGAGSGGWWGASVSVDSKDWKNRVSLDVMKDGLEAWSSKDGFLSLGAGVVGRMAESGE